MDHCPDPKTCTQDGCPERASRAERRAARARFADEDIERARVDRLWLRIHERRDLAIAMERSR